MERYKDINNDSGVEMYEIGPDYIDVKFSGPKIYKYTYQTAGAVHIEKMKMLAKNGDGLNSYIMRNVKSLFVK